MIATRRDLNPGSKLSHPNSTRYAENTGDYCKQGRNEPSWLFPHVQVWHTEEIERTFKARAQDRGIDRRCKLTKQNGTFPKMCSTYWKPTRDQITLGSRFPLHHYKVDQRIRDFECDRNWSSNLPSADWVAGETRKRENISQNIRMHTDLIRRQLSLV